jgi:glycosyltransferase involved in cell wall biosynthesis
VSISSASPLVCICIPTYNAEKTIRETLDSILNQKYQHLDIHIVDNASTDATLKVVAEFDDERIKIHRGDINVGAEGNFNRCIQLASGKYTAIYHADDIYEPDMVEKQVDFLERHSKAGAIFTEASLIDESGKRVGQIRLPQDTAREDGLYDFATMFKAVLRYSNFFICPSFMVRTSVYQQEIVSWRGDLFGSSSDLDVWLRILQQHSIGHLPQALMRYRVGNAQWSARTRQETARADFFRVTDHYLAQEGVRALLDKSDFQNYARLERRDRVMRAINLFLTGQVGEVGGLLKDIHSWGAIKSALCSKRGLGVFIAGSYLKLLLLLRLNRLGQESLGFMKRVMRK